MLNPQIATHLANLHHQDGDIRHNAPEALANLRDASTVLALIKVKKKDRGSVGIAFMTALGMLEGARF